MKYAKYADDVFVCLIVAINFMVWAVTMSSSETYIEIPKDVYIAKSHAGDLLDVDVFIRYNWYNYLDPAHLAIVNIMLVIAWVICGYWARKLNNGKLE